MSNNFELTNNDIECYKRLKTLNYLTIWEFLQKNQTKTYPELAAVLYSDVKNPDVFDLIFSLRREAFRNKNIREVSKDALVRYLHEYRADWKRSTKSINNRIKVYCSLKRMFDDFDDTYKERIKHIWDYLEYRIPPQYGWIPKSINDPIIVEVFEKFWPIEK